MFNHLLPLAMEKGYKKAKEIYGKTAANWNPHNYPSSRRSKVVRWVEVVGRRNMAAAACHLN